MGQIDAWSTGEYVVKKLKLIIFVPGIFLRPVINLSAAILPKIVSLPCSDKSSNGSIANLSEITFAGILLPFESPLKKYDNKNSATIKTPNSDDKTGILNRFM